MENISWPPFWYPPLGGSDISTRQLIWGVREVPKWNISHRKNHKTILGPTDSDKIRWIHRTPQIANQYPRLKSNGSLAVGFLWCRRGPYPCPEALCPLQTSRKCSKMLTECVRPANHLATNAKSGFAFLISGGQTPLRVRPTKTGLNYIGIKVRHFYILKADLMNMDSVK